MLRFYWVILWCYVEVLLGYILSAVMLRFYWLILWRYVEVLLGYIKHLKMAFTNVT